MKKKKTLIIVLCIVVFIIVFINKVIFSKTDYMSQVNEDEIKMVFHLDLREDIGLLIYDCSVNGETMKGGISNADRSLMKKDSTDLFLSILKEQLSDPADSVKIQLVLEIVKEYYEPNYDNDYPEDSVKKAGSLSFTADFGNVYIIDIIEDENGEYHCVRGE